MLTKINLGWLKEPRFRNNDVSNAKILKGATPTQKRDCISEAASLQSPVKRATQQSARISAPSKRSNSRTATCLYCHDDKLGPTGKPMKLYRCKCGNAFHHLCAGAKGHDDMSRCQECPNHGSEEDDEELKFVLVNESL